MNRRSTFVIPICRFRTYLRVELLEARDVPSSVSLSLQSVDVQATLLEREDSWYPPNQSEDTRVDPNTVESLYAGVGSILVTTNKSSFIGTAAAIGPRHVLTAAHVVDLNNDGKANQRDNTTGTYFILNFGEDQSHRIAIEKVDIQPHFTGFNRPAVNDDLAILTLAEDLPEGVPIYAISNFDLAPGRVVTMVGYGRSGDGIIGYDTDASLTVKRVGENVVDAFYIQDDRNQPLANEVFRFDFDSPTGSGPLGGPSVPLETQLGQGDSGGPSFISTANGLTIVGVNTFIQGANAPKYGSMGGGMNVFAYRRFINSILNPDSSSELPGTLPTEMMPLVPMFGPVSGLPAKKGIQIGAKPVSAEFAISNWNSVNTAGIIDRFGADAFNSSFESELSQGSLTLSSQPLGRYFKSAIVNADPLLARFKASALRNSGPLDGLSLATTGGEVLTFE